MDLTAWKEAHNLSVLVYLQTSNFPSSEKYSLTNQMRRAVVSISSNIAEGFSRQSSKEKLQFYYTSKGSLTELQNQLLLSKDINYLAEADFRDIMEKTVLVDKLLSGLIRSIKSRS